MMDDATAYPSVAPTETSPHVSEVLHEVKRTLPVPDYRRDVGSATFSVFVAKDIATSKWRSNELRALVREARRSFLRYGDVSLFDDFDDKAAVFLVRADIPALGNRLAAEEWLSFRIVPGFGEPVGFADLANCRGRGRDLSSCLRDILFNGDEDYLCRLASISRVCKIPPFNDNGSPASGSKLSRSVESFAVLNAFALDYLDATAPFRPAYLSGMFRPELLGASLVVRLPDGDFVPRFTPAYETMRLESPNDIVLNREHEAYRYPTYFLNIFDVVDALRRRLDAGDISEETIRHYLVTDQPFATFVQSANGDTAAYRHLGAMLDARGELVGARISGEELRSYLDREVADASQLYLLDAVDWRDSLGRALDYLHAKETLPTHREKPTLMNLKEAHRYGRVVHRQDGTALVRLDDGTKVLVPPERRFDVRQATMFGLNERLTRAALSPVVEEQTTLRDKFNAEWERSFLAVVAEEAEDSDFGVYAYYADTRELVRYCPAYWHKTVAIASSSMLIADPTRRLRWREIRDIFEHTVVAVAGGSVGSNILHNVVMDIRPNHIKIADKSVFKMENVNRVRLSYRDIVQSNDQRDGAMDIGLRNKASVAATQLYAMDPFLTVHVYDDGITEENIARFLDGGAGEPTAHIVVDEVDDPRVKILLRQEARERGIPLLMMTDVGSCVQMDVLRYDLDSTLPLSYGVSDDALIAATNAVCENGSDRSAFFAFVDALIGTDYRRDELADILDGNCEVPTSTIIPQLGSTAAMAGAIAAETIARIRLGESYPPRVLINKHTFETKIYA
jgi:molybdopterin/thiamine biosynthesis adenylyltransferase